MLFSRHPTVCQHHPPGFRAEDGDQNTIVLELKRAYHEDRGHQLPHHTNMG